MAARAARRKQGVCVGMLAAGLLAAWLGSAAGAEAQHHVRPVPEGSPLDVGAFLEEALQRSPTIASLVATLDRSDVVVYVAVSQSAPHRPASLVYLSTTPTTRYLKVMIHPEAPRQDLIAILGHELRHAVEVCGSSGVTDAGSLAGLYARIGRQTGRGTFETDAAVGTGRQVLTELRAAR